MSTTSSNKTHTRSQTYEGEQMVFKFPSEEELNTEQSVALSGPHVKPYYVYKNTPTSSESGSMQPEEAHLNTTIPQHYPSPTFNVSSPTPSETSDYHTSSIAGHTLSTFSIPTQDNISYQITDRSSTAEQINDHGSTHLPINHQYTMTNSTTIRSVPTIRRSQQSLRRNPPSLRENSQSIRRSVSSAKSENQSLYRKSSLKRTKAIKSKVGWLTRLRNMGINIKTKLRRWRSISRRKIFKFKSMRTPKLNKNKISLPVERGRAQSISELRREINEWYTVKESRISVDTPPDAQYRLIDTPESSSIKKMPPPPIPEHRIASNSSMQRVIEEQQQKRNLNYRTSVYQAIQNKQIEAVSVGDLTTPIEDKFSLGQDNNGLSGDYPVNPQSIIDEESFYSAGNMQYDNESDDEDAESILEAKRSEEMLRKYWNSYLRKVIADRIRSKIEIHEFTQIREHDEVKAKEYADNVLGLLSDYETEDSISDFDMVDSESLTSVSTSQYSSDDSNSSYGPSSDTGTNYYSTYSSGPYLPVDVIRYEHDFLKRHAHLANVKRANSLPNGLLNTVPRVSIPATTQTHSRFRSVIV